MTTSASTSTATHPAIRELVAATCSDGAPSARNLIVTVFGDVLLTAGSETEASVQGLAAMLSGFGVNERLVRTSLSRLVNEGLLAVRSEGRRSWYRVAPDSLDLFLRADERIYRGRPVPWDGQWTLVVLDGGEATPDRRAALRQELAATGLGIVAPNVLGSPLVSADDVGAVVDRLGGFDHLVVTRSELHRGPGLVDPPTLARRCLDLDGLEARYEAIAERFGRLETAALDVLDDALAAKLRLLVVSTFRRVVLADPMLPSELLPAGWAGDRARREAARIYAAVAERSDRLLRHASRVGVVAAAGRFESG